jgi:hypothetical protein
MTSMFIIILGALLILGQLLMVSLSKWPPLTVLPRLELSAFDTNLRISASNTVLAISVTKQIEGTL